MIFSGFVDTCGTAKRNRAGVLVLGNRSIVEIVAVSNRCRCTEADIKHDIYKIVFLVLYQMIDM